MAVPADIFVDGQLSGSGDTGEDWANAKEGAAGLQWAFDNMVAGSTLHLTRTFTLSATIDVDYAGGGIPGIDNNWGYVLGYNYNSGTPVIDGTKSIIDGDSGAAVNCLSFLTGAHHLYLESIECMGASGAGVRSATNYATDLIFNRCSFHDNGAHGVRGYDTGYRIYRCEWILCEFYANGDSGIETYGDDIFWGCVAHNNLNGGHGIQTFNRGVIADCLAWENAGRDLYCNGTNGAIINSGSDAAGDNGIASSHMGLVAACRATNAVNQDIDTVRGGINIYNYVNPTGFRSPTSNILLPNDKGVESNLFTGDQGYEDAANDKYNLRMGAAGFRRVIQLDANHRLVRPSGLCNVPIVWAREG